MIKQYFQSWFKDNTPKEGLPETTTFSKQFVKDAWNNGYLTGLNKCEKDLCKAKELLKRCYENYIYMESLHNEIKQFLKETKDDKRTENNQRTENTD